MNSNGTFIKPDVEYDDGCICFGPVTESQIERYKKLPRYTVVPSSIHLSQSYVDDSDEDGKNAEGAKCNENNVNRTQSIIQIDTKKNEITSFELNQSSSICSASSFLSPSASQFVPSVDLIDTATLNRYIRKESLSSASFISPSASQFMSFVDLIDTPTLNRYIRKESLSSDESFSKDQSISLFEASFTSACASPFVPSASLINTEILNRYIRKESLSTDESFFENQDVSAFNKDSDTSLDVINNCSEEPSNVKSQYLDFDLTQITDYYDVSSADINLTLRNTTDTMKDDESSTNLDNFLKSQLSVIVENKTLEEEEIIIKNGDEDKVVGVSINLVSTDILNEETKNQMLTKSTQEVITNNFSSFSTSKYDIQDFNTGEKSSKSKNITPVESANDDSNVIEMSLANIPSNKQLVLSNSSILTVTSHEESEKTFNSISSDDAYKTAIHFEESQHFLNTFSPDVEMNHTLLIVQSPDKSSVDESFYSVVGLNYHMQEDYQWKTESFQEYRDTEKKVKVNTEEHEKPTLQIKMRNRFKNSEKKLHLMSNTKGSDLKSSLPRRKLDFNKYEENNANFSLPVNNKIPKILGKSKITREATDKSMTKNEGFNVLSSLNDHKVIKPKKTIPKCKRMPILSDISNSSKK